jgi:uncharacterized protein
MFDAAGFEVITRAECLELTETVPLGRLVLSDQALPVTFAVERIGADPDRRG